MSNANRPSCASSPSLTRNAASCQAPSGVPNHGHARRKGDRGQPLTLAAVRRAAGCYCTAAIHATGKREPLEDLTDGAARSVDRGARL
jgi:hypothetical protein